MDEGLPHSEISGSMARWRLPEAYRRLVRPSSASSVKASSTCAFVIFYMTRKRLSNIRCIYQKNWWTHHRGPALQIFLTRHDWPQTPCLSFTTENIFINELCYLFYSEEK